MQCYLADWSDPTRKLWDFIDTDGTFNVGGVSSKLFGIDAGTFSPELGLSSPETGAGTFRTRNRFPGVQMSLELFTEATDHDTFRKGWGRLLSLLSSASRVLVYQAEDSDLTYYITIVGLVDVKQLLTGGQPNWDLIERRFKDVSGPLNLYRQPVILGDELDPAVNLLVDDPLFMYAQNGTNGATDDRPFWDWRLANGTANDTPISGESVGGADDGYYFNIDDGEARDLTADSAAATCAPGNVVTAQVILDAPTLADLTVQPVVQFYDSGGNPLGSETAGTATEGNDQEQLLTVTSGAAPASTDRVRFKIRVDNDSGAVAGLTLRRAQAELGSSASLFRMPAQPVPNDPASYGRVYGFYNPGDAPVPVPLKLTGDTGVVLQSVMVASRHNGGLSGLRHLFDYVNETKYVQAENDERGWDITLYNDTTVASAADDADASGNGGGGSTNFWRCAHTAAPTVSKRRWRATRTTKLDSLRGRFDVYARLRPGGASAANNKFYVRLKWAPSLADPASMAESLETLIDTSDGVAPTAAAFVEVKVGSIYLPVDPTVDLAGLALELWTRVGDGGSAEDLDCDFVWLVPADTEELGDQISTIYLASAAKEKTLGKNLTTAPFQVTGDPAWSAGTVRNNSVRLGADNKAAGWGPNAGTILGTGRHRFTFEIADKLKGASRVVYVQIANVTDDSKNPSGAGTTLLRTFTGAKVPKLLTIEFDGVSGKAYQPQVGIYTYDTSGTLDVLSVTYEGQPQLLGEESFRTDPDRYAIEHLDDDGMLYGYARGVGPVPIVTEPGLTVFAIRADTIPAFGYLDRQNVNSYSVTLQAGPFRPGYFQI